MTGIDSSTTDGILAYDYILPGGKGSGDVFRFAHGGHFVMGAGIGSPNTAARLDLQSTATEDPATTHLLRTSLTAAAPATVTGYWFAVNNAVIEHQFNVGGAAAIGAAFGSSIASTGLEVWKGPVYNARTDADPQFCMSRRGTSTYSFQIGIDSAGTGAKLNRFYLGDNNAGTKPFSITTTGNILLGNGNALATSATDGYVHIPNMAGQPTVSPTLIDTRTPMVWDTTNYVHWVFTANHGWRQPGYYRVPQATNHTGGNLDRIIACTGTGTTAQTITLPAAATIGPGIVYIIKDEAGGANTHNITITANAADGIDGGALAGSIVINTAYGVAKVYSTGAAGNGAGQGWMTY